MNRIQLEDCQTIGELDYINWEVFQGATILVTGSTGLIGSNLVNALIYNIQEKGLNTALILPVRDVNKARAMFPCQEIKIVDYSLGNVLPISDKIDFMVHLSSPTDSIMFSKQPVDTMRANINGTMALLEYASTKPIKKFIYASTMEVYGFPKKGHVVKENEIGAFDPMNARNSYPIAKIACEALCHNYHIQHSVPSVILRLTQTFGPGTRYDDRRVFAEFMRCAIEKKDIVLKTKGLTERSYLYTADAVSAIILAMIKGNAGDVYSVANPDTYCSIKEMAELVANRVANGEISVNVNEAEGTEYGYADTLYMDLDISRIAQLGWKPMTNLYDMFTHMINSCMEEQQVLL